MNIGYVVRTFRYSYFDIFVDTCSLCHVELVVHFPRGVRLKCYCAFFPGVLWLLHFLYEHAHEKTSLWHFVYWDVICPQSVDVYKHHTFHETQLLSNDVHVLYFWCKRYNFNIYDNPNCQTQHSALILKCTIFP